MSSPTGSAQPQKVTAPDMQSLEKKILAIATDAFDDEEKALDWLHEPNVRTGNRPPIELIGTPEGFHAVETVLNQIKYAIFA
jgi:putative toxin-antitoxin system antitoxin component (TIGR02293 family)